MPTKKGSVILIVISIIALLSLSAAAFFFFQNQQLKTQKVTQPNNAEVKQTPQISDETTNWKTYENKQLGFSIKIPPDETFEETIQNDLIRVQGKNTGLVIANLPRQIGDPFFKKEIKSQTVTLPNGSQVELVLYRRGNSLSEEDGFSDTDEISISKNPSLAPKFSIYAFVPHKESENRFQTIARILSTFKFLDSSQSSNQNPNAKLYSSQKLGVSFYYTTKYYNPGETIVVNEVGDKIYVTPSSYKDYKTGQWVQVFSKDRNQTLSDAIKQKILSGYSKDDCLVTNPQGDRYPGRNSYPSNYQIAEITVPTSQADDMSTLSPKWAKCPETYLTENGISYFLEDSSHPDKYVYFSIGQYGIESGLGSQSMWPDTIKFL